jgi:hypothetical protein
MSNLSVERGQILHWVGIPFATGTLLRMSAPTPTLPGYRAVLLTNRARFRLFVVSILFQRKPRPRLELGEIVADDRG